MEREILIQQLHLPAAFPDQNSSLQRVSIIAQKNCFHLATQAETLK
jgi:hypothetical protein